MRRNMETDQNCACDFSGDDINQGGLILFELNFYYFPWK